MSATIPSRQSAMRRMALFMCLLTVALMTAASFPGAWHETEGGPGQDCQCPVCKTIGHGLLHSFVAPHPNGALVPVHLISPEQPPSQLETFVLDHPARAPPA
jgi:hypothetical protein